MASIEFTRTEQVIASNGRIGQFFAPIIAMVSAWNDARITRNALSTLSDRELEDIGLCRGDIERIAEQHI
ncbi:DUF1127 domain-containing protein [Lentibacter algarum]|uniref:DUF1127 domain-containing protein n=1 Tax=Lentibacter algarum TaxID=576131 RepID=UPI001C067233|nr:DUF1127 domain-containing protein [Lentibacter algarum]MBU2980982.1 DUF1127 domain-containing protein [Lentibacter algarum]